MSDKPLGGWVIVNEDDKIIGFHAEMKDAIEVAKDDCVVWDMSDKRYKPAPEGVTRRVVRVLEPEK